MIFIYHLTQIITRASETDGNTLGPAIDVCTHTPGICFQFSSNLAENELMDLKDECQGQPST